MPLGEDIFDYRSLLAHVERLHQAVSSEKWQEVEALWFDHYALHKRLGPPKTEDKETALLVVKHMDEITTLLNTRKQDIALLLRIAP